MAVARGWAGIVSVVLLGGMLTVVGCQPQEAQAPVVRRGAADRVAASDPRAERGEEGEEVRRPEARPPASSTAGAFSASGVTTKETAPEVKREKADTDPPEPSGAAVELTLRFVPGQVATYRITMELQKSVEWKGSAAARPPEFSDGRTGSCVELTFEQRVQQVQADGSAVLGITIRGVKYVREVVNKVVLDFDSAGSGAVGSPLAALIGQGYQVRMAATGQVLEIAGVEPARQGVQGGMAAHRVAQRLLSDEEIHNRHEIAALRALKERSVRPGQSWSSLRTFSFADLGTKTYERVYTLKAVGGALHTGSKVPESARGGVHSTPDTTADRQPPAVDSESTVAVVEMKAIPSAARADELHQGPAVNPFARMSDNRDRYEGRLVLDLASGQVREYVEQMQNEWIIADPAALQTGQAAAIQMAARRLHRLEQVR